MCATLNRLLMHDTIWRDKAFSFAKTKGHLCGPSSIYNGASFTALLVVLLALKMLVITAVSKAYDSALSAKLMPMLDTPSCTISFRSALINSALGSGFSSMISNNDACNSRSCCIIG